ncbi:hypothetical protein [Olleya namhaensis]|uniref:GIY-YIG domain-containing protein n=1 Tax=Olleya namhaensis TaxID=1144750 RepID=A0A1I3RV69_9FLAO|nr:hypothetical protein [Olleya namhaensis]SFJ49802.1 hypothetical protein SAMN05443431_108157 [Olleya namhaensis]
MNTDLRNILSDTEDYLNKLKSDLKEVSISLSQTIVFNSSEFRSSEILNSKIKKINLNKFPLIYTIELKQQNILPNLLNNFEEFHEQNKLKTKNKDRVNVSKYNKTNSSFLYVGSSITDFYSRIKNHFGTRGTRVYSMHLSKWDNNISYDLIINTYEIKSSNKMATEQKLIELIEQQVWELLQPNFGKKSGQ